MRSVESRNFAEREVVGQGWRMDRKEGAVNYGGGTPDGAYDITAPATPEAQQWSGWGTALKPALEPITVARKPLTGTVAANVLEHGTGALNVDGCRVEGTVPRTTQGQSARAGTIYGSDQRELRKFEPHGLGRWPANLIHDGSDEVVGLFPAEARSSCGGGKDQKPPDGNVYSGGWGQHDGSASQYFDSGSAARFFYTAKATRAERQGVTHPTVKPLDLMAYLCRLVTPPGGTVLDPFMGSGTTIKAALSEGFNAIGIERDPAYFEMAQHRMDGAQMGLSL
jgi:site-specific DNA-methyltransferase (adenine-specific)